MLRPLPDLIDIRCVADGFALVDAFAARPVDLVLIGIHRATSAGGQATTLLLGMNRTALIMLVGSPTDIDVLGTAFARGARGILPLDLEKTSPEDVVHDDERWRSDPGGNR